MGQLGKYLLETPFPTLYQTIYSSLVPAKNRVGPCRNPVTSDALHNHNSTATLHPQGTTTVPEH